jgi:molybdopterin-guanine dinucleotide biosynthesis protein A
MFDAVILAGGRARRMGGIDKPALEVGGTSLLRRAVDAAGAATRIVVVGPQRDLDVAVVWTQEEPPGGGPVAAVAAGLGSVSAEATIVLAADLPSIDAAAVGALMSGLGDGDAALAVDDSGRDQYLCAAYRTEALRANLTRLPQLSGAPMHSLVAGLRVARLQMGASVADIDTPEDLPR